LGTEGDFKASPTPGSISIIFAAARNRLLYTQRSSSPVRIRVKENSYAGDLQKTIPLRCLQNRSRCFRCTACRYEFVGQGSRSIRPRESRACGSANLCGHTQNDFATRSQPLRLISGTSRTSDLRGYLRSRIQTFGWQWFSHGRARTNPRHWCSDHSLSGRKLRLGLQLA
jgi:hypothetical protein